MKWMICFLLMFPALSIAKKEPYIFNHTISKTDAIKDFDLFYKTIQNVHPSINDFINKPALDKKFKEIRHKINGPITELVLSKLVNELICYIGCGHTVSRPSITWYNYMKTHLKVISLNVKLINEQLYIWNHPYEDSISLKGAKIISINGIKNTSILKDLRQIIPGDGYSLEFKNFKIENSFRTYFTFSYGTADKHEIVFTNKFNETDTIFIPTGIPIPKLKISSPKGFKEVLNENHLFYYKYQSNHKIALLDINAFQVSKFRSFYKNFFKMIHDESVTDLIIDLRNNTGGYFPHGNYLLSYILKSPFTLNFSRPSEKIERNKHLKMYFGSKMTKVLFKLIPDRVKNNNRRDYQIRYKPKKRNHFNGNVYVLINGGSFSMSSYVSAKLKHNSNALLIGSETGGGEYGSNAVINYDLILPHSKIRISIPYFFFDHQVDDLKKGKGIIPNYAINYSFNEIYKNEDKALNRVLNLINN